MTKTTNYASVLVGYLNRPHRQTIVTEKMLTKALRAGSVNGIGLTALQRALLASLFNECSVTLICAAVKDLGFTLEDADKLYLNLINEVGMPINDPWETFRK